MEGLKEQFSELLREVEQTIYRTDSFHKEKINLWEFDKTNEDRPWGN